jgi:hypothetical protein
MLRYAAVILLVLCGVSTAQAQMRYGAKGGVSFGTTSGDSTDNTYRTGLAAGAFFERPLGPRLTLQPEVLFIQKGSKFDSSLVEASFRIDYLEVPVLVRYNLTANPGAFFVYGGPAIAFKLKARSFADFGGSTVSEDVSDDVENVEWSLVAGGGKEFSRFFVEGRYVHGMKNIDKLGSDAKTRTIAALLGVRF